MSITHTHDINTLEVCIDGLSICEIDARVTYRVTPGRPGLRPSLTHPGEPAEEPEIEVLDAVLLGSRVVTWRTGDGQLRRAVQYHELPLPDLFEPAVDQWIEKNGQELMDKANENPADMMAAE